MHEVLLLGIAVSGLTVLLISNPRGWSRRLSLFLMLLFATICYSWFILGMGAIANAIGATLTLVWFAQDLVDPPARDVLARWALVSVGLVALLSLDPLNFPLLSLRSGHPINLVTAVLFLMTGPVNHLITTILQCARSCASTPVSGWISVPVLSVTPAVDAKGGGDDVEEPVEPEVISDVLSVLGVQAESEGVTALHDGRWVGPLERPLIIILASVGAKITIATVVATKGIIRFPEISQDPTGEKAEEFLIGSVSLWILAALVSILTRVVSLR